MNTGSATIVKRRNGSVIAKIAPGDFYVTSDATPILTVLGSCVSACIRDPVVGVGGMNHFMLPVGDKAASQAWGGSQAVNRFGNQAMDSLILGLENAGALRARFEVKLFGGGRVLDLSQDIGAHNVEFALSYLEKNNIPVETMDVGEDYARKLIYEPATGVARMKKLREVYRGYVVSSEKQLLSTTRALARDVRRSAETASQKET